MKMSGKAELTSNKEIKARVLPVLERKESAMALCRILADTYFLSLKTQKCHWNVTGPLFHPSHLMFEDQYKEMFQAIDELAERIRSLDHLAPGSFREFSELSEIEEKSGLSSHHSMIADLIDSHEVLVGRLRMSLDLLNNGHDVVTEDLIVERLSKHEKALWMLKSQLI